MASTTPSGGLTPSFIYLLLIATLGPFLFGYHLAELNAPQKVITCAKEKVDASTLTRITSILSSAQETHAAALPTLPQCISMDSTRFGMVTSFFTLGGLIGALAAGPVTAKQGRLRVMIYAAAFAVLGPIFEAAAPNFTILTLGRFLSGIGAGAATVVVPIYISEISPPSQRGFFGAFTQILTNCGILFVQVLGLFLSRGQLWRIILAVGGAVGLMQAIGLTLGGQESPKWLADNGEASKGKSILRKIRGRGADIEEEVSSWGGDLDSEEETLLHHDGQSDTQSEQPRLARRSSRTHTETIGVFGVVRNSDTAPAVFAVVMIMMAQQFTGINSIIMYGVALLSDLLGANSGLLNCGVAVVNVVITASCAPLSDRWGRKTCILLSVAGMGISSILLAFGIMNSVRILSVVSVVAFVASFGFGIGPIPFILASELVNTEAVGATQSWALASNWISTFIVAQFFPLLNDKMGKGQVYFIFAAMALVFGAIIFWFVPETRGKRNADEVWGRKKASTLED